MLTSELLDLIKQTAAIPSQATFSDQQLLDFATDEMKAKLYPLITSVREDYFLVEEDLPIVSGQQLYSVPERAIGGKLAEVNWTNGNDRIYNLTRVATGQEAMLEFSLGSGRPQSFGMQGSKIKIFPRPSSSDGFLRVSFYQRPNKLVLVDNACRVTNVSGNDLTVSAITDSRFVTSALVDIVDDTYGFDTLLKNKAILNIAGQVITVTDASLSEVEIGDYVCIRLESPVIQMPLEATSLLVTLASKRVLEAQNDSANVKLLMERAMEQKQDLINLMSPRVENESKKVINPYSFLREW